MPNATAKIAYWANGADDWMTTITMPFCCANPPYFIFLIGLEGISVNGRRASGYKSREKAKIEQGQPIASLGGDGAGQPQELIFKIYAKDKPVNPASCLP